MASLKPRLPRSESLKASFCKELDATRVPTEKWTQAWVAGSWESPSAKTPEREQKQEMQSYLDREFCEKFRRWQGGSFGSQDSACTRQTFRIPADHCLGDASSPTLATTSPPPKASKEKIEMVAMLELCTDVMRNALMPENQRSTPRLAKHRTALLADQELTSMTISLVDDVLTEIQSKSRQALHETLQSRMECMAARERQLTSLKREAAKKRHHPLVGELSREVKRLQEQLGKSSKEGFQLKREIHESAIKINKLRRKERDASQAVDRLEDMRGKYGGVCVQNRELNRTIQHLQGAVRVVCHVPPHQRGSYIEATNRRDLLMKGKLKKSRTYKIDGVLSGMLHESQMQITLKPLVTSVLDGMDGMLIGMGPNTVDDQSCFGSLLAYAIESLLSMAEERLIHASHDFDFELSFITVHDCHEAVSRTNLTAALETTTTTKDSSTTTTEDRTKSVAKLLADLMSMREQMKISQNAHVVLKIHVQTHNKLDASIPTNTTSTLTFIQIQPPSTGKWKDCEDMNSVASALVGLSSSNVQPKPCTEQECCSSRLMQEVLRQTSNPQVRILFMELHNAPGSEKEDLAALNLCSKVMDARLVPMDAEAEARKALAHRIKRESSRKDQQIARLEQEKSELSSLKNMLHSDIDRLSSEVDKLQAIQRKKQNRLKKSTAHSQKPLPREPKDFRARKGI